MAEGRKEPSSSVSHEGTLMKKCRRKTWTPYWVVLKNRHLYFFVHGHATGLSASNTFAGSITLTEGAKCSLDEKSVAGYEKIRFKRQESFKFKLKTKNGVYLFKTGSELERKTWLERLDLSTAAVVPRFGNDNGIVDESDSSQSQRVLSDRSASVQYKRLHRAENVNKEAGSSQDFSYDALDEEDSFSENEENCRSGARFNRERSKSLTYRLTNRIRANVSSRMSFRKHGYQTQL